MSPRSIHALLVTMPALLLSFGAVAITGLLALDLGRREAAPIHLLASLFAWPMLVAAGSLLARAGRMIRTARAVNPVQTLAVTPAGNAWRVPLARRRPVSTAALAIAFGGMLMATLTASGVLGTPEPMHLLLSIGGSTVFGLAVLGLSKALGRHAMLSLVLDPHARTLILPPAYGRPHSLRVSLDRVRQIDVVRQGPMGFLRGTALHFDDELLGPNQSAELTRKVDPGRAEDLARWIQGFVRAGGTASPPIATGRAAAPAPTPAAPAPTPATPAAAAMSTPSSSAPHQGSFHVPTTPMLASADEDAASSEPAASPASPAPAAAAAPAMRPAPGPAPHHAAPAVQAHAAAGHAHAAQTPPAHAPAAHPSAPHAGLSASERVAAAFAHRAAAAGLDAAHPAASAQPIGAGARPQMMARRTSPGFSPVRMLVGMAGRVNMPAVCSLLGVLALGGLVFFGLRVAPSMTAAAETGPATMAYLGEDLDGNAVFSREFSGSWVWLVEIGQWSAASEEQTRVIADLRRVVPDDVRFRLVMVGGRRPAERATPSMALAWITRHEMPPATVLVRDRSEPVVPRHILLAPDGRVRYDAHGFHAQAFIERLLELERTAARGTAALQRTMAGGPSVSGADAGSADRGARSAPTTGEDRP